MEMRKREDAEGHAERGRGGGETWGALNILLHGLARGNPPPPPLCLKGAITPHESTRTACRMLRT